MLAVIGDVRFSLIDTIISALVPTMSDVAQILAGTGASAASSAPSGPFGGDAPFRRRTNAAAADSAPVAAVGKKKKKLSREVSALLGDNLQAELPPIVRPARAHWSS